MMNNEFNERLVIAYERLALAVEGLRDEAKKAGARYWPPQKEQREPILTRVETDQERELKMQGARRRTIQEIVDPLHEEELEDEYVGARARQWLKDHQPEKPSNAPTEENINRGE